MFYRTVYPYFTAIRCANANGGTTGLALGRAYGAVRGITGFTGQKKPFLQCRGCLQSGEKHRIYYILYFHYTTFFFSVNQIGGGIVHNSQSSPEIPTYLLELQLSLVNPLEFSGERAD
jgi:hypothetical protein